jgi:uncharacterized protein (TIGR02145 family)
MKIANIIKPILFAAAIAVVLLSCSSGSSQDTEIVSYSSGEVISSSSSNPSSIVSSSSSEVSSSSSDGDSSSSSEDGFSDSSSSLDEISSSSDGDSSSSSEDGFSDSSSSSDEASSSSSEGYSSDSSSSSSSSSFSSSSALKECDQIFNPATRFCYDGAVYDRCDGMEYNPTTHICVGVTADRALCGGVQYNPLIQDCCDNNAIYALATQVCQDNAVFTKCGTNYYDPATHGCRNNIVLTKCGVTELYDPPTQFCYNNSKVGDKCGARTEVFDPDLYKCVDNSKIYLKAPVSYDGGPYEAVLIGTQTWMVKNLNYNASGSRCYGEGSPAGQNGYTYDDYTNGLRYISVTEVQANCANYGRLYNWATAMNLESSCNNTSCSNQIGEKHRGICPSGWHITNRTDWNVLGQHIKGLYWNWVSRDELDFYGFTWQLGGGGYPSSDFRFGSIDVDGYYWNAESSTTTASSTYFYTLDGGISGGFSPPSDYDYVNKQPLFSVRCVKD